MLQKLEFNLSKDAQEPLGVSTTSQLEELYNYCWKSEYFFGQQPDEFPALTFFYSEQGWARSGARRSFRRPDARAMGLVALKKS